MGENYIRKNLIKIISIIIITKVVVVVVGILVSGHDLLRGKLLEFIKYNIIRALK